ncbi:cellobiose transport system substrate-binding protein [Kineococcus xinjiangensis]|uniref:Cellobiose transport system substrate-binding protein n=1 Tax=Kineococcus xinjiangensis TaxID=512762 RepID=A0A2S6IJ88_9ACTN|nr:extracellular solute-binding protein [Kineococcus xinjiangensis]PPK94292.1 cellobiose transport system substrate-binding protein [Kineococcus xinjiangensis]
MRSTKKTTIASLAVMVSGALLLSSCGSSDAGSSEASESSAGGEGKTVLTVSLFGTMGFEESGLFDEYEKQNPNIDIKYESTQGETKYWPALQTKLQSGTGLADIQGIEVARIADVVANQSDKWTDLSQFVTKEQVPNYLEWKAEAATTEDGKVLALGTDIGPMGICYRSDLLEQAGLPTDPAELAAKMPDWDAYLELGRQYKANAPAGSAWTDFGGGLYNAIVSTEETIYYDESGEPVWDSNPAVKEAFDTAAEAGQEGLTAKLEQFNDPNWEPAFANGGFATIACPSWMIGYIKGKAGDAGAGKWNVTSLPGGAGGNWGGSYLAIPEASENKEEAAKLIKWMTDAEQQATVFNNVGNFPSNKEGIALVGDTTDEYFQNAPIGKVFSESAEAAPTQILGEGDGVIKTALTNALLSVEANGVAPADAWENAKAEISNQLG